MNKNDSSTELYTPIDQAQLSRIESVHRGFFYQHLYAVACLLSLRELNAECIIVERDEDLELMLQDEYIYVQVKTRQDNLQPNDLTDTMVRFETLRAEHSENNRSLKPLFYIVSNVPPGPKLSEMLIDSSWPVDVAMLWPGEHPTHCRLPQAWSDIASGLEWCEKNAENIPLGSLPSQTLVLKLAALVQWAATGHHNHTYHKDELENLFEQIVIQLQDFPKPPILYRPHKDEPELVTHEQLRLITGFSGAGKTAWVSQMAQHSQDTVTYFDIGDLPGQAIANSLSRELTARFFSTSSQRQAAGILAANSGLEHLRAINEFIRGQSIAVTIVLDNVHRMDLASLRSIIEATSNFHLVMLAQPWQEQAAFVSFAGIVSENLQGWTEDTIAEEFNSSGNSIDINTAIKIKELTSGFPLFVKNASHLTRKLYTGSAVDFVSAIENQLHTEATAQEVILKQVFEQLSSAARFFSAMMSLSDVPLNVNEVQDLCFESQTSPGEAGKTIRELTGLGVFESTQNNYLKLHNTFYILAKAHLDNFPEDTVQNSRIKLRDLLVKSLLQVPDLGRSSLWARLLPQTGQTDVLIDLATTEIFHERGIPQELKAALESASNSLELSISDRFWALDGLVFWNYQEGIYQDIPEHIQKMESLITEGSLGIKEKFAVCMKQMLIGSKQGNTSKVEEEFQRGLNLTQEKSLQRLHRYNYAQALFLLRKLTECEKAVSPLIREYYECLGLSPDKVFAKNLPDILPIIQKQKNWEDDAKHLADCLNLYATARQEARKISGVARLHALKFYEASSSYRSAVKAGQDAADDILYWQADARSARQIMEEHVLQILTHVPMPDLLIGARSQYAVILAYCGEIDSAKAEMAKLLTYEVDEMQQFELESQNNLIEEIAAGRRILQKKIPPPDLDIIDSLLIAQQFQPIVRNKKGKDDKSKKLKAKQKKLQRRKNRQK